jgi:hypothetical protein
MVARIILIFLLAAVAQARGANEVQGAQIKGTVILNGEDGPGVAKVRINDSAHTGGPWTSDSDGGFTLDYPKRAPGEKVRLGVIREGYVVVNWAENMGAQSGRFRRCAHTTGYSKRGRGDRRTPWPNGSRVPQLSRGLYNRGFPLLPRASAAGIEGMRETAFTG